MADEPDLSTLPNRMRYAATVLDEARTEYHNRESDNSNWLAIAWNKGDLCSFAGRWERNDVARTAETGDGEALTQLVTSIALASAQILAGDPAGAQALVSALRAGADTVEDILSVFPVLDLGGGA